MHIKIKGSVGNLGGCTPPDSGGRLGVITYMGRGGPDRCVWAAGACAGPRPAPITRVNVYLRFVHGEEFCETKVDKTYDNVRESFTPGAGRCRGDVCLPGDGASPAPRMCTGIDPPADGRHPPSPD
ncbi:hypothetical protein ACJJTC_016378 [Scirpophaga incertulas]